MEYTVDAMHWRASTTNPAGRPPPAGGTGGVPPGSTVAPAVTASFVCEGGPVGATIRDYAPGDEEAAVELSLRAWAPVAGRPEDRHRVRWPGAVLLRP
jgi:hypothetical protein